MIQTTIDVQDLIIRKLQFEYDELKDKLICDQHTLFSTLNEEVTKNITANNNTSVISTVPNEVYRQFVSDVLAVTQQWPNTVWKIIHSILDKSPSTEIHGETLHSLVNQFSWKIEQAPFTIGFIDLKDFKRVFIEKFPEYEVDQECVLKSIIANLKLINIAEIENIKKIAKKTRVKVSIELDEYLLEFHPLPQNKKSSNSIYSSPANRTNHSKTRILYRTGSPKWRSENAKRAANMRHNQPGGSIEKQESIRQIWATGKYASRNQCAEKECEKLGMSFKTARNALLNTPTPKKPA